jgi:quinol monooxygenase YgiN
MAEGNPHRKRDMITIIAKWSILEGKTAEALAALKILEQEVKDKEPFVPMYTINTPNFKLTSFPTPPPTEVIFVSAFDDFAAFEKHLNGPVFQGWLKKYIHLFLTNNGNLFVVSEWLERQFGYIRQSMVTH